MLQRNIACYNTFSKAVGRRQLYENGFCLLPAFLLFLQCFGELHLERDFLNFLVFCKVKTGDVVNSHSSLEMSHTSNASKPLTAKSDVNLSQTTIFRLFETDRVCRRQFQICWRWQKAL